MLEKTELKTVEFFGRPAWRKWLAQNHGASPGVWLVFYKKAAGVAAISYNDALREALCHGWVDSLVKRLDESRYARKFTPRRAGSKWSDINRALWAELQAAGELAAPGLAAAPTENRYPPKPVVPTRPRYIAEALKRTPAAWRQFQALPPSHRRQYVEWIHTARREQTRQRRLAAAIALLKAGKPLGLK